MMAIALTSESGGLSSNELQILSNAEIEAITDCDVISALIDQAQVCLSQVSLQIGEKSKELDSLMRVSQPDSPVVQKLLNAKDNLTDEAAALRNFRGRLQQHFSRLS